MFAVIQFPGSNDDRDMVHAMKTVLSADARLVWHQDGALPAGARGVLVPGGFSYGDYLRAGAVARFSPIMQDVVRFAEEGGLVLGICNGFQVLCESGLLPGTLMRNEGLRFICKNAYLRTERTDTAFTGTLENGQVLQVPVAHGEGNYYADEATLNRLEANGQVVFRYSSAAGDVTEEANFNGSARNIAGLVSEAGNVLGMMPHPERCAESVLGRADGALIFRSMLEHLGVPLPVPA